MLTDDIGGVGVYSVTVLKCVDEYMMESKDDIGVSVLKCVDG